MCIDRIVQRDGMTQHESTPKCVSVPALAQQLIAQFGTDETEQQCLYNFSPELVNKIDGHNDLNTHIVCIAVCTEYVETTVPIYLHIRIYFIV